MILLVGPPGSGKSTFCHQAVLRNIEVRPVICVATEAAPSKVLESLRQKGLGEVLPHPLGFVDAFHETVGLSTADRSDTVNASSGDLTSLDIAVSKLREGIGESSLFVFDSLTPPYLMNGTEILRFMRMTLLRLATEGNAVLACVDEGCGKPEDLVAMMSIADGLVKIEIDTDKRFFNVVKYPRLRPTRIEAPITPPLGLDARIYNETLLKQFLLAELRGEETTTRGEVGDYVNLFWPNLARWCCMLWDPRRFPRMMYELNKDDYPSIFRLSSKDKEVFNAIFPWRFRLMLRFALPKNLSEVKNMRKLLSRRSKTLRPERVGIMEYLADISKTDKHIVRVYENFDCWGFENVGTTMASHLPPFIAGMCKALESMKGLEREWNAIETKCIGLGDPYCEFELVPGEITELGSSLEKSSAILEKIHDRLMTSLMSFLLHGRPLVERPKLGSDIHLHPVWHTMALPAQAGARFRAGLRMGGARAGKEIGERLVDAGVGEDEAEGQILNLLEQCKVGKVSMDETIRMAQNCESFWSRFWYTPEIMEPSCFFTTGFLNGFFHAVKNQHVKETRCIAMGDPYCEWEFR